MLMLHPAKSNRSIAVSGEEMKRIKGRSDTKKAQISILFPIKSSDTEFSLTRLNTQTFSHN